MTLLANPYLLFAAFLVIGLASRYPRLQITNGAVILELTELLVFLAAVQISLFASLSLIAAYFLLPLAFLKLEGPLDIAIRVVSLLAGLPILYMAQAAGYSLALSVVFSTIVSSTLYAIGLLAVFGFPFPVLLIVPIGKAGIYYTIYIPIFVLLGAL